MATTRNSTEARQLYSARQTSIRAGECITQFKVSAFHRHCRLCQMPVRNLAFDLAAIEPHASAASSAGFTCIGGDFEGADSSGDVACTVCSDMHAASVERINDDEGTIADRAGAAERAGSQVWVRSAVSEELQNAVRTSHCQSSPDEGGCVRLPVSSVPSFQLSTRGGDAPLPTRAADQGVRHAADVDTEHNECDRRVYGGATPAAGPERSRHLQGADEAIRAVYSCACNSLAPDGDFVGEAGEGAGET
eukprot:4984455-Pleurochrysis_carterae.AAC.1